MRVQHSALGKPCERQQPPSLINWRPEDFESERVFCRLVELGTAGCAHAIGGVDLVRVGKV
eukprot:8524649-Pyramimonas_sp.AAC.1